MITQTKQFIQWLLPNYCLLCKAKTQSKLVLCDDCIKTVLPWQTGQQCEICAIPLNTANTCGQCLKNPPDFQRVIAPLVYAAPIDHFIPQLKFSKKLMYSHLLGHLLGQYLENLKTDRDIEVMIPIPLHRNRLQQRGFNQSTEIAKILGNYLKIPLDQRLLKRQKATESQSQLKAREREKNLKNAFSAEKTRNYKRIALIDDVITTASTAREASKTLRRYGAQHIEIWCVARATKR